MQPVKSKVQTNIHCLAVLQVICCAHHHILMVLNYFPLSAAGLMVLAPALTSLGHEDGPVSLMASRQQSLLPRSSPCTR